MKKNLLALGVILMSALTFTACSDDNDFTYTQPAVSNTDVYVACAGNWNANDGTVGILDYNSESRPTAPYIYSDAYRTQNGIGIGDAQDLIVFGTSLSLLVQPLQRLKFWTEWVRKNRQLSCTMPVHAIWQQMVIMFTSLLTMVRYTR